MVFLLVARLKKYFASLGRILSSHRSSGRTVFTVFLLKEKENSASRKMH